MNILDPSVFGNITPQQLSLGCFLFMGVIECFALLWVAKILREKAINEGKNPDEASKLPLVLMIAGIGALIFMPIFGYINGEAIFGDYLTGARG